MSVYKCHDGEMWGSTDWECFGPSHATALVLVTVLYPCFLAFSLVVSSVFLDRSYGSDSITARAHGRVGIAMISLKTGLTLLFTVAADANPWFLHIVIIILGLGWLYLWLRFLPSYTQWMNQAWSAFGAVFLWGAMCAALAKLLNNPNAGVAGYVFFLGVPTVAFSGYAMAHQRFHAYGAVGHGVASSSSSSVNGDGSGGGGGGGVGAGGGRSSASMTTLYSPWDVELQVRYILRDVMREAQRNGHGHGGAGGLKAKGGKRGSFLSPSGGDGSSASASAAAGGGHDVVVHMMSPDGQQHMTAGYDNSGSASGSGGGVSGSSGDEANEAARQEAIAQAAQLFAEASLVFPQSATLDLMHANFIRCFVKDPLAELAIIQSGLSKEPGMDVRFLLSQAKHQLEEIIARQEEAQAQQDFMSNLEVADVGAAKDMALAVAASSGNGHRMGIIERVQFDKLMSESIEHSLNARVAELRFWAELRILTPDAARLHAYAEAMSTAVVKATRAFEKLVHMQPGNVDVLQTYAVFLLEVRRESREANRYFDRADVIVNKQEAAEEAKQRSMQAAQKAAAAAWGGFTSTSSFVEGGASMAMSLDGSIMGGGGGLGSSIQSSAFGGSMGVLQRGPSLNQALWSAGGFTPGPASHAGGGGGGAVGTGTGSFPLTRQPSSSGLGISLPQSPFPMMMTGQGMRQPSVRALQLQGLMRSGSQTRLDGSLLPGAAAASVTAVGSSGVTSAGGVAGLSIRSPNVGTGQPGGSTSPALLLPPSATVTGTVHGAGVHLRSVADVAMMTARLQRQFSSGGLGTPKLMPGASFRGGLASLAASGGPGAAADDDDDVNATLKKSKNRRGSLAMASYAANAARARRLSQTSALDSVKSGGGGGGSTGSSITPSNVGRRASLPTPQSSSMAAAAAASVAAATTPGSSSTKRNSNGSRNKNGVRRSSSVPSADVRRKADALDSSDASSHAAGDPTHLGATTGQRSNASGDDPLELKMRHLSMKGGSVMLVHEATTTRSKRRVEACSSLVGGADESIVVDAAHAVGLTRHEREPAPLDRAKAAAAAARERARQRRQDRDESAAQSLRAHLKSKATSMEPSLILLSRALTILFVLAGIFNVVIAAMDKAMVDGYGEMLSEASLATQRQVTVERILHGTHNLALMSAGVLPYTNTSLNATFTSLKANGATLESLHRSLLFSIGGKYGLPAESDFYSANQLDVFTSNEGAVNRTGNATEVNIDMHTTSFSNVGVQFAAKAALLAARPLGNITVNHPDSWYILVNGPTVVRQAMNASTMLLDDRVMAQMRAINRFNITCAMVAAIVFGLVGLLVVMPIVLLIKGHTDEIFAVFLALPDGILADMQYTCAGQINQLKGLFDDELTFSNMTGGLHMASYMAPKGYGRDSSASGGGDDDEEAGRDHIDDHHRVILSDAPAASGGSADDDDNDGGEKMALLASLLLQSPVRTSGGVTTTTTPARTAFVPPPLLKSGSRTRGDGGGGSSRQVTAASAVSAASNGSGRLFTPPPLVRSCTSGGDGGGGSSRRGFIEAGLQSGASSAHSRTSGGLQSPGGMRSPIDTKRLAADMAAVLRGSKQVSARNLVSSVGGSFRNIGDALRSPRPGSVTGGGSVGGSFRGNGSFRARGHPGSASSSNGSGGGVRGMLKSVRNLLGMRGGAGNATGERDGGGSVSHFGTSFRSLTGGSMFSGGGGTGTSPDSYTADGRTVTDASDGHQEVTMTRRHLHHSFFKTQIKLLVRFAWPVIVILIFYGSAYWYAGQILTKIDLMSDAARGFGQIHVGLMAPNHAVRYALAAGLSPYLAIVGSDVNRAWVASPPGPAAVPASSGGWDSSSNSWAGTSCNATALRLLFDWSTGFNGVLLQNEDDLVYGNTDLGLQPSLSMQPDLAPLMLDDACAAPGQPEECNGKKAGVDRSGFYNGLINDGLQPAFGQYVRHVHALLQVRIRTVEAAAAAGQPCPSVDFSSPDGSVVLQDQLAHVYLSNGFAQAQALLLHLELQDAAAFKTGIIVMCAASITGLLVLYFFVLLRSVRKMDGDMKRTRGTLLMFPPDVLAAVANFMGTTGVDVDMEGVDVEDDEEGTDSRADSSSSSSPADGEGQRTDTGNSFSSPPSPAGGRTRADTSTASGAATRAAPVLAPAPAHHSEPTTTATTTVTTATAQPRSLRVQLKRS